MPRSQVEQHRPHLRRHGLRVMPGRAAVFFQARFPFPLIALQPLVAGLAADFIAAAQFREASFRALPLFDEISSLVQGLPLFPGHGISCPLFGSSTSAAECQPCRRSKVSTMSPVRTQNLTLPHGHVTVIISLTEA